jgi:hypothetical protein
MGAAVDWLGVVGETLRDALPIALVILGFQVFVLRQPIPHLRQVLLGFLYVVLGMALFLLGLERALFPIGRMMAAQLTHPGVAEGVGEAALRSLRWHDYGPVYLFAAAIGFSTTVAEPALIAVANKANLVSGGAIDAWGLRVAVAVGVSAGVALGCFRIVTGLPLQHFIIVGYVLVIVQTLFAPRLIVAVAYDSGGVTTSTVTVPLVTALGLGLAASVPGRRPSLDGFGLVAFASLFPIMTVLGYAQLAEWRARRLRALRAMAAGDADRQPGGPPCTSS